MYFNLYITPSRRLSICLSRTLWAVEMEIWNGEYDRPGQKIWYSA